MPKKKSINAAQHTRLELIFLFKKSVRNPTDDVLIYFIIYLFIFQPPEENIKVDQGELILLIQVKEKLFQFQFCFQSAKFALFGNFLLKKELI